MPPCTPHSHVVIFQLSPQINIVIPQRCFAGRNDSLLSVPECVLEGKVQGASGSPSQAGQRVRARERTLMVQPAPGQGGKASEVPSSAAEHPPLQSSVEAALNAHMLFPPPQSCSSSPHSLLLSCPPSAQRPPPSPAFRIPPSVKQMCVFHCLMNVLLPLGGWASHSGSHLYWIKLPHGPMTRVQAFHQALQP